jgi:arylsulfatase A-like enzyme
MATREVHEATNDRMRSITVLLAVGILVSTAVAVPEWLSSNVLLAARLFEWQIAALTLVVGGARALSLYVMLCVTIAVVLRLMSHRINPPALAVAAGIPVAVYTGAKPVIDGRLDSDAATVLTTLAIVVAGFALYISALRVRLNRQAQNYLLLLGVVSTAVLLEVWALRWLVAYGPAEVRRQGLLAMAIYAVVVVGTMIPIIRVANVPLLLRALAIPVAAAALYGMHDQVPVAAAEPSGPPTPVNSSIQRVLLLTIDTLRADALSSYGGSTPTPHLDSLAADSVVFKNAISASSWTVPAMMSVMTGLSPQFHGAGMGDDPFDLQRYPGEVTTLAEYLSQAGFFAKALVGNSVLDRPLDLVDGFDSYDIYDSNELGRSAGGRQLMARFPLHFATGGNTAALTRDAIEWLGTSRDRPFLLWMHYLDPHWPYAPPPETYQGDREALKYWATIDEEQASSGMIKYSREDRNVVRQLYATEVARTDAYVGKVIDALKEHGLYDGTLIIVTSDHGEEFWERGDIGHGHSLYREVLNVPLIIKLPAAATKRTIDSYVPTQALLPTLLDLTGIPYTPAPSWVPSLAPLTLAGSEDRYDHPIISAGTYRIGDRDAAIAGGKKIIFRPTTRAWELHDLASDPREREPLHDPSSTQTANALLDLIRGHHQLADRVRPQSTAGDDATRAERLRRLRSLGYIQ